VGRPDWQQYADWTSAPIFDIGGQALGAGLTEALAVSLDAQNYRCMLFAFAPTGDAADLTWEFSDPDSGFNPIASFEITLADGKRGIYITPTLARHFGGVEITAGATDLTYDLAIAGVNQEPSGFPVPHDGFILSTAGNAIAAGPATETHELPFYAGRVQMHLFASVALTFAVNCRDAAGTLLAQVFARTVAAGTIERYEILLPPRRNQLVITNAGGAGQYDAAIVAEPLR
jgi:hypothetical protein